MKRCIMATKIETENRNGAACAIYDEKSGNFIGCEVDGEIIMCPPNKADCSRSCPNCRTIKMYCCVEPVEIAPSFNFLGMEIPIIPGAEWIV